MSDHEWRGGDRFRLTAEGKVQSSVNGQPVGIMFDDVGVSEQIPLGLVPRMEFIEPPVVFERGDIVQNKKHPTIIWIAGNTWGAKTFSFLDHEDVCCQAMVSDYTKVGHIDGY